MKILLKTIHGSHLYGLNHAGSDQDWFSVVSGKGKTTQTIQGDQDNKVVSLDKFMWLASQGSPQSLEAMFSTKADVDEIPYLRYGFRAGIPDAIHSYSRTISSFSKGPLKHQRHAIRLAFNINSLYRQGYFDPTLSDMEKRVILSWDGSHDAEFLLGFVSHMGIDVRANS